MKKLTYLLCIVLISCTASRNRKATARVLSNTVLTEQVGRVWEKSNPCVIDTVVQFKNGVETVRYDTLMNEVVNTVYDTATKTNTVTEYKTVVKYINKTDTVSVGKTDFGRLNMVKSDNDRLQAEVNQLKTENSALKKRSNEKTWIIIALVGFILLVGILKYYLK